MHHRVRTVRLVTTTAIALGSVANTLRADEAPANIFDFVGRQPIAGLPAGPYRAWSDAQKGAARKLIQTGCFRLTMDGNKVLAEQNAPGENLNPVQQNAVRQLLKEEAQTLALTCIAMHLPKDHPELSKLKERALQHYTAAKVLGTKFPPPTFGG